MDLLRFEMTGVFDVRNRLVVTRPSPGLGHLCQLALDDLVVLLLLLSVCLRRLLLPSPVTPGSLRQGRVVAFQPPPAQLAENQKAEGHDPENYKDVIQIIHF